MSLTTTPRRSRENTRSRLVEAAADVFAEKPLRRVTVDDVVTAAGFTRGAFYSNFAGIDELFFEVYAREADRMLAVVQEAVDTIPPEQFSVASLRAVLGALRPYGRRWFLLHGEFALHAVRDAGARDRFVAEAERLRGSIEDLVGRVLALLDREPIVSLNHVADVLVALHLHTLGNEQLGTGNLGPDELVDEVLPSLLLGLSTSATS